MSALEKSRDAFRTISEVADDLDVPQHVLRFWESKFAQVRPLKRAGGRRYYRPDDIDLLRGIKTLLYADGFTIKGVQRVFREQGLRYVIETGRMAERKSAVAGEDRPMPVSRTLSGSASGTSSGATTDVHDEAASEDSEETAYETQEEIAEEGGGASSEDAVTGEHYQDEPADAAVPAPTQTTPVINELSARQRSTLMSILEDLEQMREELGAAKARISPADAENNEDKRRFA